MIDRSEILRIYFEPLFAITPLFCNVTAENDEAISISFWETASR
jgi:hypothetical protein